MVDARVELSYYRGVCLIVTRLLLVSDDEMLLILGGINNECFNSLLLVTPIHIWSRKKIYNDTATNRHYVSYFCFYMF